MSRFIHEGKNKEHFVRDMFARIVGGYDLLNRIMTGGLDTRWRKKLVGGLQLPPKGKVLDLACGTGDVAKDVAGSHPGIQVVGADPVQGMLIKARAKAKELIPVCCIAEALPFPSDHFNAVTVAFGIRNFSKLKQGLAETCRILRKEGQISILEFGVPDRGLLKGLYRWHINHVLRIIGALFGQEEAYAYLTESIRHFPQPAEVAWMLKDVGYNNVSRERILGGAVWLYRGTKT